MEILVPDAAAEPGAVLGGHDGLDHDVSRRLPDFRLARDAHQHPFAKTRQGSTSLSDCVEIRVREKIKRAGLAAATALQMRQQRRHAEDPS